VLIRGVFVFHMVGSHHAILTLVMTAVGFSRQRMVHGVFVVVDGLNITLVIVLMV